MQRVKGTIGDEMFAVCMIICNSVLAASYLQTDCYIARYFCKLFWPTFKQHLYKAQ